MRLFSVRPLVLSCRTRYTSGMDNADRTARNIQEAMNFETLLLCSKRSEISVESIMETIGEMVPLSDPMTLHPNTYAQAIEKDARDLLEMHSFVKSRFFRLDMSDHVMKRGDPLYPEHIGAASESPRFLYTRGDTALLAKRCVCVTGTRNPSNEGKQYTKATVETFVAHDVAIVSGLSLGIDGIAHISTLANHGSTIAVLATPLIDSYPTEHRDLQRIIGERGLLVTRFSPAVQPQKWHVLLRNRLMGSLGVGSIIVEDRDGGSAVKHAAYALEQRRRVVIFQHVLDNRSILWPRKLSLMPGVMVVKRPEHIHARLFAKVRTIPSVDEHVPDSTQLPLFDLA